MAARKNLRTSPKQDEKNYDILEILKGYKKKIITGLCGVAIVAIIVIYYTHLSSSRENESWYKFSLFRQTHAASDEIPQNAIDELLTEVDDSDVEPWALYFLAIKYFSNRNIEKALETISFLEEDYKNHYLCISETLLKKTKSLIEQEKAWTSRHSISPQ